MNDLSEFDRNNLDFLLSLSAKDFEQFMDDSDLDDLTYALELVRHAISENLVETAEALEQEEDFTEANQVLARFRLDNVAKKQRKNG